MGEKPCNAYRTVSSTQHNSSSDTEDENIKDIKQQDNSSRRSGMRFSTIEDFLASLNTATTAVVSLQGLQNVSLESYKKCMQGSNQPDAPAGDAVQQLNTSNISKKDKPDDN